ncbi:hypothetical protein [Persicitalea jodogahamensis]|uniref:Uncharacterized protein n=1 Tax=Persicitalea jodogahamensis TaxID=402147 RepID=A0A8J3D9K9_9BACT|nr:hypothetical protein [Persicitalea jodogahamensis]GHB72574.1 hypothetical protein GCM10007390_28310 [Persicitalea jodogahamensis]
MNLQLIKGQFQPNDAVEIITRMVDVKIRYHEGKITSESAEEDIKMRERRIKQLQKELFELRQYMEDKPGKISLNSTITIST